MLNLMGTLSNLYKSLNYLEKTFQANLKPELKMTVAWNTCGKRTWPRNEVYLRKLLQKFTLKLLKVTPFRETYVKYLEENSI